MAHFGASNGPLDPSLFSQATPSRDVDAEPEVFDKGDAVWYRHRSGTYMAATVTAVDRSALPPFYQIEMIDDGTIRDTERPRLRQRSPGQPAPAADARVATGAPVPGVSHAPLQQAAAWTPPAPSGPHIQASTPLQQLSHQSTYPAVSSAQAPAQSDPQAAAAGHVAGNPHASPMQVSSGTPGPSTPTPAMSSLQGRVTPSMQQYSQGVAGFQAPPGHATMYPHAPSAQSPPNSFVPPYAHQGAAWPPQHVQQTNVQLPGVQQPYGQQAHGHGQHQFPNGQYGGWPQAPAVPMNAQAHAYNMWGQQQMPAGHHNMPATQPSLPQGSPQQVAQSIQQPHPAYGVSGGTGAQPMHNPAHPWQGNAFAAHPGTAQNVQTTYPVPSPANAWRANGNAFAATSYPGVAQPVKPTVGSAGYSNPAYGHPGMVWQPGGGVGQQWSLATPASGAPRGATPPSSRPDT